MSEEKTIEAITDERGSNYGHPADHFQCTQDMFSCWEERRSDALSSMSDGDYIDYDQEQPLRHIVYMICDKLTRAAQNPLHMDNFDDIQGYASLWAKCVERNNE